MNVICDLIHPYVSAIYATLVSAATIQALQHSRDTGGVSIISGDKACSHSLN